MKRVGRNGRAILSLRTPGGTGEKSTNDRDLTGGGPRDSIRFSSTGTLPTANSSRRTAWDHGGKSRYARGYGRAHEKIRERLLREVILCEECSRHGRVTAGKVADHIIPLAKGGTGDRSNYQLLCWPCSNRKTALENGRRVKRRIGRDGRPIKEPGFD